MDDGLIGRFARASRDLYLFFAPDNMPKGQTIQLKTWQKTLLIHDSALAPGTHANYTAAREHFEQ